ncbi:GlcNAc-PI de-N-acetylase [Pseudonocardia ammonioxydans]|uniref:GlcNAc-PI de-N-acetylase n=1 Tax=Pseudonocardia ammonioxydans TaxID=260086 RepID=A0A1I4XRP1_PSUAM|nr:PIG-L family deacetylase [Pseudonocardia ammonioxydans]SFN27920.1 GlcNAc-PI de-N-acetylase [Pseudonocardia ammonioxydans]
MGPRHSADVWEDAADALAVRQLDPAVFRRLVVVAAHPADDTLGAGGLLRAVAAAGGTVDLVLAGAGAAAQARQDRTEVDDALAALDVPATVHRLGMPDSAPDEQELATALAPLLTGADAWAGPWRDDPHPDHAAVGRACRTAAPVTAHGFGFPIRARTRLDPTDPSVPWDRGYRLVLSETDRAARSGPSPRTPPGPPSRRGPPTPSCPPPRSSTSTAPGRSTSGSRPSPVHRRSCSPSATAAARTRGEYAAAGTSVASATCCSPPCPASTTGWAPSRGAVRAR